MNSIIRIHKIKGIGTLEFKVPESGVHVVTGVNGSGKTTLMTCLERLTNADVFRNNFKPSSYNNVDVFKDGYIEYEFAGKTCKYIFKDRKWVSATYGGSVVLKNFGFNKVLFFKSVGERFYIQEDLGSRAKGTAIPEKLKTTLNEIFRTERFNSLGGIPIGDIRGKGGPKRRRNLAFFLRSNRKIDGKTILYTEKNFSLGEILVINLIYALREIPKKSLILIDEIELALHPKVQVNLIRYLERIATEKESTILISTHSSSIIKSSKNLIFLEKDESTGKVDIHYNCYPAVVLRDVALSIDEQPDYIFPVEDEMAQTFLEEMLSYYFQSKKTYPKPVCKTIPIGGKKQVLKFTLNANYLFSAGIKVKCCPDKDVETEISQIQSNSSRTSSQTKYLDIYNSLLANSQIYFLPITPELGLINFLESNLIGNTDALNRLYFISSSIDLVHIFEDEGKRYTSRSSNLRDVAKQKLSFLLERIELVTTWDADRIRRKLFEYYVIENYKNSIGTLSAFCGPLLS